MITIIIIIIILNRVLSSLQQSEKDFFSFVWYRFILPSKKQNKKHGPRISSDTNDIAPSLKSSGEAVFWISTYPTAHAGPCSSCFTIEHIHHWVRNHINTCPFPHLGRAE